MPTGYTADIYHGKEITPTQFAAQCARAFGAFMHQRDDSLDTQLAYPESPEGGFYDLTAKEAVEEYKQWLISSEEEKYAQWSEYAEKTTASKEESMAKSKALRARYTDMLNKIEAISVPESIMEFKKFMIEQLESSIQFDCPDEDSFTRSYWNVQEYSEWCRRRDTSLPDKVARDQDELAKDWKRYAEQVEYIDTLAKAYGIEVRPAAS